MKTKLTSDTIYDVIKSLVGEIEPYADSAIDKKRKENMKVFIEIFDRMHSDIDDNCL